VPDHVSFLGHRQDAKEFIAALDIFALSSETEGIPVSLLEAMAAEKPVVATAVGGNPQVINHGQNGLLVSPLDPASLARAILTLMEDGRLSRSIAREGYQTIKERFSACVISKQYLALYGDLLEKKDRNHAS
jgi:glycosyltransferase involved in cell wall biosynthesis